jgi:putative membrane protein
MARRWQGSVGMNSILGGSIAGLVATAPMTAAMAALHRQLPRHERHPLPPREITERVALRAGAEEAVDTEQERESATWVAHFGYGAATGALYGLIARRIPGPPFARGILWGLAVWTGSYLGWLPAAGIRAASTRQPPRREALMVASHVVFGGVTGVVHHQLSRRPAA